MLDTNTVSYFVRGHTKVDQRIVATPLASLCVSSITAGELLYGLAKRPMATYMAATVTQFLRRIDVLPWDAGVAERYGVFKAASQRQGKVLGPLDLLIAAHALAVGAVLVTNDRAFSQIEELQLEDWTT
jgi:tRNA(fMet)-specific endonuclease VapC